jgi:hypothetical protein
LYRMGHEEVAVFRKLLWEIRHILKSHPV